MPIEFEVSQVIPASAEAIYEAWLSTDGHTAMTGSPATATDAVGETFEAWEGYIQGRNLELEAPRRIVQSWRTMEFDKSEEDSRLEILLTPEGEGTLVTLRHSMLPEHGMQYQQGWVDSYFLPMLAYFGEGAETADS